MNKKTNYSNRAILSSTNDRGSLNYQWAIKLIHCFSQLGVDQAVISPGSRSTPLALACQQHPKINTWLQIDERCASFFALGLAQKSQQSVLIICTSGSAVANWFPAVVEANYSYSPLILLSADRPEALQHCGANQTIDQKQFFGSHVRKSLTLKAVSNKNLKNNYLLKISRKIYLKSLTPKAGPVHLNIPFNEPLLPKIMTKQGLNKCIHQLTKNALNKPITLLKRKQLSKINHLLSNELIHTILNTMNRGKGLIICGRLSNTEHQGLAPLLAKLAKKFNCPILLDPLSKLRFTSLLTPYAIVNYDHSLKQQILSTTEILEKPDWLIRFGQFPLSKNLMHYLKTLNGPHFLINSYADNLDPIHKKTHLLHLSPKVFCYQILQHKVLKQLKQLKQSKQWLQQWKKQDTLLGLKITEKLSLISHLFEGHVIDLLLKNIPDNSLLFSGNSMVIRDFDTFISNNNNARLDIHANRGASGIDGNLSTFFGLLAKHQGYGSIVLGDLSFYHDMNALLIAKELATQGVNASIIILNNNGGAIFNYLPQQQLNGFYSLWNTDTGLDFQYTARLYQLKYTKITSLKALKLKLPKIIKQSGISLIEIIIDQKNSVECHTLIHHLTENK